MSVLSQVEQGFRIIRFARKLLGIPVRSMNLEGQEVSNSVFFTEIDPAILTPEDVRLGPIQAGDAAQAPFTITKPKIEGKTPGFFVTDGKGVKYLLKLDPVEWPELLSGADIVTSKLLSALGYNVPSNEILSIYPEELQIGEGVIHENARRGKEAFTKEKLDALLKSRIRDGNLRVAASRIVEGEILGPARLKKFRDCTEIRALRLVYAWVNNIDSKDHNTLLVWDGEKTVGYLFDFGTSLGAHAGMPGAKTPCVGWRYVFDPKLFFLEFVTLGFYDSGCSPDEVPFSKAVGLFSARFNPTKWKPYAPNIAFDEMNDDDARWIAYRMSRLTRSQIEAAVAAGRYTDPQDAGYLSQVLVARRDIIVRQYLDEEHQSEAFKESVE